MTDWKQVAITYAMAFAEMRTAYYAVGFPNSDADGEKHLNKALEYVRSVSSVAIEEMQIAYIQQPEPPVTERATDFEWRDSGPQGPNWYQKTAPK